MSYSRAYYSRMVQVIERLDHAQIEKAMDLVEGAWKAGQQIFTFGNGGSGSTASHFICDWNKGVSYQKVQRIRGICLNDNLPTLLAYSNDVSYESVFMEQLKNFLQPGDLVIGISGSGNSPNVLRAIEYANEHGGVTLGLCGFKGGKLKDLARYSVHVKVDDMQLVEDVHLSFGHCTMQRLCGYAARCFVDETGAA